MTDHTPALQRPATRTARLSAIEQALLTRIVTSQSQLSQILADQGIEVTQATLSRDLDEMHATKTRLADGTVAFGSNDVVTGNQLYALTQQVAELRKENEALRQALEVLKNGK